MLWNKDWLWHGWTIIKWPFGFLILCFVLLMIWNLETRKDYDKEVLNSVRKIKDIKIPTNFNIESKMIQNIK